jgi:hypothetical protein
LTVLGCNRGNPAVSSMELPEGNCIGTVSNADGAPVKGASILLVPEGYSPLSVQSSKSDATLIDSTVSDAYGHFGFSVSENSNFNLLAHGEGRCSMHQSVHISANARLELTDEILLEPGSISGTILLQSTNDQGQAIVLLMGTNRYVTPSNAAGHFYVPALAQGAYHVRFLSMASGFSEVDTIITVTSGTETALTPVMLRKISRPTIDSFTVNYDPLMMNVTLSWKAGDTAPVDSFAIYCNRENNITPMLTIANTITTATLDIIALPVDTFVYQIAAIGKDGWEGESVVAEPVVKRSAFTATSLDLPDLDYDPYSNPCVNNGTVYNIGSESSTNSIGKLASDLTIEKTYSFGKEAMIWYESKPSFDREGNVYILVNKTDTTSEFCIQKFDRNLNPLGQCRLGRVSGAYNLTFAVSPDGSILVYTAIDWLNTKNSSLVNDKIYTTVIRVFDPDFELVSETDIRGKRKIQESVINGETVTAMIYVNNHQDLKDALTRADTIAILSLTRNDWALEQIVKFDAQFTAIGTIHGDFTDIDRNKPAFYTLLLHDVNLQRGSWCIGRYHTDEQTLPSSVLYFADDQGKVVARIPTEKYMGPDAILVDHVTGDFYLKRSGSGDHENILLKFSMDESLFTKITR